MEKKKNKILTVEPFTPLGFVKIQERHGKETAPKFKPKKNDPRVVAIVEEKGIDKKKTKKRDVIRRLVLESDQLQPKRLSDWDRSIDKMESNPTKARKIKKKRKPKVVLKQDKIDAPSVQKAKTKQKEYIADLINQLRLNATKAELFFKGKLDELEIVHEFQYRVNTKKSFIVADFYIAPLNMVVELDGGYHNEPEQQIKDSEKDEVYRSKKLKVLRMTNEQVYYFDFNELKVSANKYEPTKYLKDFIN